MTRYSTIYADPPWDVMAGPLNGREGFGDATGASRPLAYPSMTVDEIKALRVADVALDDAHLYMWTTNGYLPAAFDVAKAWGFQYSTTLVWAKRIMGGGLGGAFGISTEFLLFCRRGSLRHERASTRGRGSISSVPTTSGESRCTQRSPPSSTLSSSR